MKKFLVLILAGAAIVFMAGCATSMVLPRNAKPLQPLAYASPQSSNDAQLTVVRDTGLLGFDCGMSIYVGTTQIVTDMYDSDSIHVWLTPGNYTITAKSLGGGICPHLYTTFSTNMVAQQQVLLRTGFSNGSIELGPEIEN